MSQNLTLFIQELLAPLLIGLQANLTLKIVKNDVFIVTVTPKTYFCGSSRISGMCKALESGQIRNHDDPNSNIRSCVA